MIIILTTVAKKSDAEKLAYLLVENKIAACVNIIKTEKSIYIWKGKINNSGEFLLLIKTAKEYKTIEGFIKKNHPYDLPEIIMLKPEGGLKEYLDWVISCQ